MAVVSESVHEWPLCWRVSMSGSCLERASMGGSCVRESVHEWQLCWREQHP